MAAVGRHRTTYRRHLWLAADRVLPVVLHVRRAVATLLTDHLLQRVLTVVHDLLLDKLALPLRLLLAQPAETVVAEHVSFNCYFVKAPSATALLLLRPPRTVRGGCVRVYPAELHIVVAPEPPPPSTPLQPTLTASDPTMPRWSVDDALGALDAAGAPSSHADGDENVFAPPRVARAGPAMSAAATEKRPRPAIASDMVAHLAAELQALLPLLRTIVSGETPSWRRDAFFHGHGRARTRLRDPASVAGLSSAEAEVVLRLLLDWFVGDAGADRARTVALVTDVLAPEAMARLVMARQSALTANALH